MIQTVDHISNQVNVLARAIQENKLIDTQLNVVDKGCGHCLMNVLRWVFRPILAIFGVDTFGCYRADQVSRKILAQLNVALTADLKEKIIEQILTPLDTKTSGKYHSEISRVQAAIRALPSSPLPSSNFTSPSATTTTATLMSLESTPPLRRQSATLTQTNAASSPVVINACYPRVIGAINHFAHRLHLKLSKASTKSLCFSPVSLVASLGLILKGLSVENKHKFLTALGLNDLTEDDFHTSMQYLLFNLGQANGMLCTIDRADGFIALPEMAENEAMKREMNDQYQASFFPLSGNSEDSCRTINHWVNGKTDLKIPTMFKPQDLRTVECAIFSAIHFVGKWSKEFTSAKDRTFTFEQSGAKQVKMMSVTGTFNLLHQNRAKFRMIDIPCQSPAGHQLTHLVFLPDPGKKLSDLEAELTPELIADYRSQSKPTSLALKMPQLNLNVRQDRLLDILAEMGIPVKVDLPFLSPAQGKASALQAIIHQVSVQVDDEQSTGPAAPPAVQGGRNLPLSFWVSRDYLYFIMDKDVILFQGNVRDPSSLIQ